MEDLDMLDLSFIGMGSYINEKDSLPEETDDLETIIEDIKTNYIAENFKRKQTLRPFEQHVQKSINKIK